MMFLELGSFETRDHLLVLWEKYQGIWVEFLQLGDVNLDA